MKNTKAGYTMANVSFFGIELAPGKEEPTPIPSGIVLHISQATLAKEGKDGEVVRIFAIIEDEESDSEEDTKNKEESTAKKVKREFAIATLVGKSKESQNLELNFSEIDGDVYFKAVGGQTTVHLTGYYNQVASEEDMFEDYDSDEENGLPPKFAYYDSDEDKVANGDESSDEEFKVNESDLNESNDSGHFISGSDDEEEEEGDTTEAKQEAPEKQDKLSNKRKSVSFEDDKQPAKKQKTEQSPKKEAQPTPKKKQQQQTPAKNEKQQTPKQQQTPAPKNEKQQTPAKNEKQQQPPKNDKQQTPKNDKQQTPTKTPNNDQQQSGKKSGKKKKNKSAKKSANKNN